MRIRFKPWARGELEASPFYVDNPQDYKNKWKSMYKNAEICLSWPTEAFKKKSS